MSQKDTYLPHYTYDDWLHWEGRWELIEGHPIAMSPMPLPEHQKVSANMMYSFMGSLKKGGCKTCKVYLPIDYKIADDTILQPDLLIVCGKIEKSYLDFPPSLVVEVLSPATAIRDRNFKFKTYMDQRVKYYLTVDLKTRRIEINNLEDDSYRTAIYEHPHQFDLTEGCSINVDLSEIWD